MRIAPIQWLLSLATVSTMVGAEPTIEPVRSADAALERGRAIIAETFGVMSGTLAKAMREGGATNAVKFCSENVAQLAGGIARTNHVSMRRVSHRARNPGNRADAAELELIERLKITN